MQPPASKSENYFVILAGKTQQYIDQELNFEGYIDTVQEYHNLKEDDIETAWRLAKELNAWAEYMSDLTGIVNKRYLDAKCMKQSIHSKKSCEYSPSNVSKGEREANQDESVIAADVRRNTLLAFKEALEAKTKFLERAYYHCKSTWEMGKHQLGLSERLLNNRKNAKEVVNG